MIKNIIVQPSDNISVIVEYFDFNRIPYSTKDFWDYNNDVNGICYIPQELIDSEDNLLIINYSMFYEFVGCDISKESLIKFSKKNQIWVWNDIDGILMSENNWTNDSRFNNLTLFADGIFISPPTHLNVQVFPVNCFLKMPRIKSGSANKTNCKYDFLLTTIVKSGRAHRDILLSDLSSRSIKSNGLISQNPLARKFSNWIGDVPTQHDWRDGFPSIDLYRQCWFEIAPETLHWGGYFYTEKTNKPIVTKTPFLTVSSRGYLAYLRSLGFKTFDSLINESYDQQDVTQDRVRLMLNQAEDIIANGSEHFYNAAIPILEHNYNHLAEISGKWDHLMDAFITQQLEHVGFKL